MDHRSSDGPEMNVPITRALPLWGILSALGTGAVGLITMGIVLYTTVERNGERQQQTAAITQEKLTDLSTKVGALTSSLNSKDLKDQEHDFKINDHERRITLIEAAKPPAGARR